VKRLVAFVCAVFILEAALYAALTPLLPHLARSLGLSRVLSGVLTGAYAAGVIPGAMLGSWLSSRHTVRTTVQAGLLVLGVSSAVFGVGDSFAALVAARAAQGLAAGAVWGGALAWLVATTGDGEHGRVIGITFGAATFGMIGGPVLGALSLSIGTAAVFGAVGACALGLTASTLAISVGPESAEPRSSLLSAFHDRSMTMPIWLVAVQALPVGVLTVLVPLRLAHLGASRTVIAGTFLVAAACGSVVSPFAGRLGDRRGHVLLIGAGLLLGIPCLVALSLGPPLAGSAILVIAFLGVCRCLSIVPSVALMTADAVRAGTASAVPAAILTASSVGETVGSAGGASLAQVMSDAAPYLLLAVLYAATIVALGHSNRRRAVSLRG
jgi:predicted MFS family arabinose efflux permease